MRTCIKKKVSQVTVATEKGRRIKRKANQDNCINWDKFCTNISPPF